MKEANIEEKSDDGKFNPPNQGFQFGVAYGDNMPKEKKSTEKKSIIVWIFGILLFVIFALPFSVGVVALSMIADGLALSLLWQWFIVPAFNVPLISITTAIGISLLANV